MVQTCPVVKWSDFLFVIWKLDKNVCFEIKNVWFSNDLPNHVIRPFENWTKKVSEKFNAQISGVWNYDGYWTGMIQIPDTCIPDTFEIQTLEESGSRTIVYKYEHKTIPKPNDYWTIRDHLNTKIFPYSDLHCTCTLKNPQTFCSRAHFDSWRHPKNVCILPLVHIRQQKVVEIDQLICLWNKIYWQNILCYLSYSNIPQFCYRCCRYFVLKTQWNHPQIFQNFNQDLPFLNLPVNVAAAAAPSAAADAFSPSATVTCFLKLAGDDLLDFEVGRDSVSSSTKRPTV